MQLRFCWAALVGGLLVSSTPAAEPAAGWRGNGTGLWPEANPPLEWFRVPRGALDGMRARAARPAGTAAGDAPLIDKGRLPDWLVLGPFAVKDSVRDFDEEALKDESAVEPTTGEKVGDRTWTAATVPADDIMVFGEAKLPWLDLAAVVGSRPNQLAYAHTYLYSPRGGRARMVADHGHGLKVRLNGKVVYRAPERAMVLGGYPGLSQVELHHLDHSSPRFDIELRAGWNRLLLKLGTDNKPGFNDMRCSLRIMDPPDVPYESKNIRWMTRLPGRSTSTPLLVGDRLFVLAEPDQILCLDRQTGRIRWSAAVNYFEALTAAEREANPAYAARVDPLTAKLAKESDPLRRVRLRAEIRKTLLEIDRTKFQLKVSGHFESHFGIVGFTMPTPVSDGRHVFVWNGTGVAACFDLDGKRQWITRVETDEINYGSSPALADGVLVVFLNSLYGLDARTGKLLWEQRKVANNVGALLAATLGGQPVIVTQQGNIVRPSDGEVLYRQRDTVSAWAPPVILGQRMYSPQHGVNALRIFDFAAVKEAPWKPALVARLEMPVEVSRGKDGKWIDRSSAGSPLVWDGLVYQSDIYQVLYVTDLKSGKLIYRQEMDLSGLTHYNAVAVTASPTLVGKHILVSDNQGTMLVLEPGPKYKVVARNRIATQVDRRWPIPAQETIGYAPPIPDGDRLYLRGEEYLYCIGKE
jgi:outer membrane protein assembly factor BamB